MSSSLKLNNADAMVVERSEEGYGIEVYEKAMDEYKANPITYTLEEVERELGL